MCMLSFSNMIYHKFSHGAVSYTLNGKNINVMLEVYIYLYYLQGLVLKGWIELLSGREVKKAVKFFDDALR